MRIDRLTVAAQVKSMLDGKLSCEDLGWWAFDLLLEDLEFEPGYERLLDDALRSLQYFHDNDPLMRQFYPDKAEIIYYLKCLSGEEFYRPSAVMHWRV